MRLNKNGLPGSVGVSSFACCLVFHFNLNLGAGGDGRRGGPSGIGIVTASPSPTEGCVQYGDFCGL